MNLNPSIRLVAVATIAMTVIGCQPQGQSATVTGEDQKPVSEGDKVYYYVGTLIGKNLSGLELTPEQSEVVIRGVRESLAGTAEQLDDLTYQQKLQEIQIARQRSKSAPEREAASQYVAKMAAQEGAITTDSGLVYLELTAGEGESPTRQSVVRTHYTGTLRDGTVFDSSVDRGQPLEIPLASVIPCWTEGIAMMKVGGKARLTCPPDIAYGDGGSGPIPAGAALTFEVELLGIVK